MPIGLDNKSTTLAINEVITQRDTAFEPTGCILDQRRVRLSVSVHGGLCSWGRITQSFPAVVHIR